MHTLTKDQQIEPTIHSALIAPNWELFLPNVGESDNTGTTLRQAETIIRAQEERIRLLETMVLTDELTGLTNRRGLTAAFERELALARRDTDYGGMLAMIDLDGFKTINDKWGHAAGDAYLQAVAQALQDCVRTSDVVARLGGDEFAVLLTHMNAKAGAKRLAKLELAFNNRSMLWKGKRLMLRASFGVTAYAASDNLETAMHMADVRLYAHKARSQKPIAVAR